MVSLQEKREALIQLPQIFPELSRVGFALEDVTSSKTSDYNCIAYAAKDETQPWWPMPRNLSPRYYYWPIGLPREYPATVENFFRAFETLDFKQCSTWHRELGYEKVAIFVDASNVPTHMARELGDGVWHSKLGDLQDIRHHVLSAVENPDYGMPKYFMRKPLAGYPKWKRGMGKLLTILRGLRPSK